MIDDVFQLAGKLLAYGMVFGFAVGAFLVLATSAFCAVVHTIAKVMNGGR